MSADNESHDSFDEIVRSIAREVSRSVEERMAQVDVEEIAGVIGVDPAVAKEWVEGAGRWLRDQAENLGDEVVSTNAGAHSARPATPAVDEDPLRGAGPHPLDLPTGDQGLALAALDSGRWTVEPGSNTLAAHGEGPRPSDALGLVRELRVRDWITADGEVTVVGRDALRRWLASVKPR